VPLSQRSTDPRTLVRGRSVAFTPVIDAALTVLDGLKSTRWEELKTERQRADLQDLAHFVGTVRGEILNIEAALESQRERATPKLSTGDVAK